MLIEKKKSGKFDVLTSLEIWLVYKLEDKDQRKEDIQASLDQAEEKVLNFPSLKEFCSLINCVCHHMITSEGYVGNIGDWTHLNVPVEESVNSKGLFSFQLPGASRGSDSKDSVSKLPSSKDFISETPPHQGRSETSDCEVCDLCILCKSLGSLKLNLEFLSCLFSCTRWIFKYLAIES